MLLAVLSASNGLAQGLDLQGAAAQIVKADADFAQSVADRNRDKFLSLIADAAISAAVPRRSCTAATRS
jgi:hypothetical protein